MTPGAWVAAEILVDHGSTAVYQNVDSLHFVLLAVKDLDTLVV